MAIETVKLDALGTFEGSTDEIQRIYLIRHGQSILNVPDDDGVQRCQGTSLHVALTVLGETQAQQLSEKLIPKIGHLDLSLISSDALRAKQTIDVFEKHFKKEAEKYPGLRELSSGIWEGQRKDADYKKAYKVWQDLSPKDKFITPKTPEGESPKQVVKRAVLALNEAVKLANGKTILGVCHDMTSNALYLRLNQVELSDKPGENLPHINLANCDIILIEVPMGKSVKAGHVAALIKTDIVPI
jgi:broad specificity phosphatase PhoE